MAIEYEEKILLAPDMQLEDWYTIIKKIYPYAYVTQNFKTIGYIN